MIMSMPTILYINDLTGLGIGLGIAHTTGYTKNTGEFIYACLIARKKDLLPMRDKTYPSWVGWCWDFG